MGRACAHSRYWTLGGDGTFLAADSLIRILEEPGPPGVEDAVPPNVRCNAYQGSQARDVFCRLFVMACQPTYTHVIVRSHALELLLLPRIAVSIDTTLH